MGHIYKITSQSSSSIAEQISKMMNYPARSFVEHIDKDEIISDLARLVAYPSCSFEGFDIQPSLDCADEVARMVRDAGFQKVELLDVGGRTPVVWAEHRADQAKYPDAPTLFMYAHYDIQPAPVEEQGWETDPWQLTSKDDGRYYGRGAADDKAGIVAHLHAIEAAGGLETLDHININICFEGEEECFGTLEEYVANNPERFEADVYLIFDLGNVVVGEPTLITTLRGAAIVDVEVETTRQELHSGAYGGPTPDALVGLTRLLATLWDDEGNTAIEGVKSFEWEGASYPEELFRRDIGLVEGADLMGTGPIDDQLFSRPAANIIGLNATPVDQSSNVIVPHAKVRLSIRFPHGQTADEVAEATIAHLKKHTPKGMVVRFPHTSGASAFVTDLEGPYARIFSESLAESFEMEPTAMGGGASIPLLAALQKVSPQADFLLYGVADMAQSNIHGGNESVDLDELTRTIKAEAIFLKKLEDSL